MRFLILAACLLLTSAATAEEVLIRQITVTGEAEQNFAPDKAEVMIAIEGRGKTLAEAKQKHDELLTALHQAVSKFSIDKSKVKTLSNSINPQYDYVNDPNGNGRQVLRGYSAEHRVQVTIEKLDSIGEFINALVARNIDRIEQVSYGLRNSDSAEMQVSVAAVKNAKSRAAELLGALDSRLGKVISVSTDSGGYHPRPVPMMAMAKRGAMSDSAEAAAPIPDGDVAIRKQVTVQFEIQ